MNQIERVLQKQHEDVEACALAWALEPDERFAAAAKNISRIIIEAYSEDIDTVAIAETIARKFILAAAARRDEINSAATVNATRTLH